MFQRSNQISAISQEVVRLLTHPGWKKFRDEWDRRSIDRFLDKRDDELRDNPFARRAGRFNAREETHAFLSKVLQGFVDMYAEYPYSHNMRFVHAANELSDILRVPIPQATPRNRRNYNEWWTEFMQNSASTRSYQPAAPLPPPAPAYQAASNYGGTSQARLPPPNISGTAWKAPEPPASDERKLEALKNLMTHPSTPEHERRAAFEAYARLIAKMQGAS